MAWLNLFGNRDQKVTDSEQVAIDSIARELKRSETPTGAINTLSDKVRKMVGAVASRIRSVVGGSSDAAKAAVLAAAASTAQMPAHAGQDFQPSQNIGNNFVTTQTIERDKGSPLIVTGGVVQDGDQFGGSFQLRTENADNSAGLSLRATQDHAQLSASAARKFGYKEGGSYSTVAGAQILIDRRDAQSIYGPNVGDGPLQGIQVRGQSGTTFNNGKTTLDVGVGYKKALDVNLGSNISTTSTQSTLDTGATIDTIQTDTITTTQTVYKGKGVADMSLGTTQLWDNDHQAFSLSTKYRRTDGEPSELGSNVRYQIIGNGFGEKGRNRFSTQLSASDLGMKNPTYGLNFSHAVGPHGSIGISVGKTEGSEPFVGATYSYSFDGNRSGNFSLPISAQQTPGSMVADMNNDGQNPNIFPYRQLGSLYNTTTVNQVSKVVSSITKTLITPSTSSISLKAGETKDIEISVQGDAQPVVTTDGGVIAELIPIVAAQPSEVAVGVMMTSAQDTGAKKFIVRVTAPVDASRTNATVTVSAGNTKVDIPTKITGIINQAPIANSDSATTDSNTPIEIAVLNNDKDPEGQPLSIASATVSSDEGSVLVTANNTVLFTPKPGFVGTAVISYTVKDSQGALSNATFVSVKVNAVVDPNAFSVAVSKPEVILEPNSEANITLIANARILSVTPLKLPSGIMVNFTPDDIPSPFALMARARVAVALMTETIAPMAADTPDQSIQVMTGDDVTPGTYTIRMAVVSENGDSKIVTMNVVVQEKPDTIAPEITLNGAADVQLTVGDTYTELGVQALDNKDGDISSSVQMSGSVDTNTPGTYTITYTVADKANNVSQITRTVVVQEKPKVDTSAPEITLNGAANVQLTVGDIYTELGANAIDDKDGDISSSVQMSGSVDTNTPGTYTVTYTVTDKANNVSQITRTVVVQEKPKTDIPTTYAGAPDTIVDQTTRSVRVTNPGSATDADGIVGYQYYLVAPGVRIANTDGNFTDVPPGTYTLEVDALAIDGATGAVKVATNPNKPTITIEAPKVDAPTIYSDITGVRLSDSSFQITSSGISDADGEIASLLYIATNTRTSQQLVSSKGRFDNLDWGDWVVVATGMAKDGATGALTSVRNDRSDLVYRFTRENPDPAPVAPAGSAFASLGDIIVGDFGGNPAIGGGPSIIISAGGIVDPLGRSIVYSATGLPDGLTIDANTGVISGIYNSDADWGESEIFSVVVSAQSQGSSQVLQKSFVLSIRNDG